MVMQVVLPRSEIAVDDTWNVEDVFVSPEAWSDEMAQVAAALPELARFRGHLADSPQVLKEWLQTSNELRRRTSKVFLYASMLHNVDTANQTAAGYYGQASSFSARMQAAVAFAEPELLAIGVDQLGRWMEEEPALAVYSHYFDQLDRRRAHVRSAEVEELLSQAGDAFMSATRIHGTLTDADLRFDAALSSMGERIEVVQGNLNRLVTDPDREVRRSAWENYADAHLAVKNTAANCLATGVKQHVFLARARNYASSLQAALEPTYIPEEVFRNLIETFRARLPVWHKYWRVRRKALGYEALHAYDIKAPLTSHKPEVPFEQAIEWIVEGMQPLGAEYVDAMRRGASSERWVDKYPNRGKRSGAYSSGVPGTRPFILMSYNNDLFSMSTLAHELGHSLHSYFTWQTQPLPYSRYGLFVAEVASNFNQALVRAHLLSRNPEPEFEIAVLEEAMSNFHRYFFLMPTLARFELEIHERVERGEGLTADSLIALMTQLFREGYGDEVVIDEQRIGITWAQFATHLYANFYVYQYATGIGAANALAQAVFEQRHGAAENYLAFLRAGSSLYPLDALKLAGIDMSSPLPVEQAFDVLSKMVDRLEQLTNKG